MREIKFRAWEKHSQTMTRPWELSEIIDRAAMWCNNPYWEDPVMQFTGLHDKNGVEIYEGDIVKVDYVEENINFGGDVERVIETVSWQDFYWYPFGVCGCIDCRHPYPVEGCKVIGNIHENPELLEQSND